MKRLVVVVTIAVAGFIAAFISFGDAARRDCVLDATPDPSYSVEFDALPSEEAQVSVLRIQRDDRPVTGAEVCVNVRHTGPQATGASAEGVELVGGRYAVVLDATARGSWEGRVLIMEDGGRDPVAVPLSFDVTADASARAAGSPRRPG